ncbi:MAG: DUF5615 family PIN-like protein [Gammaproteobacteria bacterium]|nr:DUF5615 family PIN-like protein [Gammaproteobacteria bacterium]MDE0511796.1 DUF5615 family PIN-like protein [Gammaproteobacteria bacterium]
MKLLFDESVPRRLARSFPDTFDIRTVPQMGWAGIKNGLLLTLASQEGFDALVTTDRSMEYQQNPDTLPVTIIVLISYRTRVQDLEPLIPKVVLMLNTRPEIGVYHFSSRQAVWEEIYSYGKKRTLESDITEDDVQNEIRAYRNLVQSP